MPARARAPRRPTLSRIPLPRPRLYAILLVATVPLALGFISEVFVLVAVLVVLAALLLAALDAYATPRPDRVPITRVADPQLSIGVGNRQKSGPQHEAAPSSGRFS